MRSPEALLKPSFEASKNFTNFNFKYEEHSKRNYPNHLPRSQRSLESRSKASRNLNKPQIGETDSSFQSPEELLPQTFKDEEHTKNVKNKEFLNKLIARDSL